MGVFVAIIIGIILVVGIIAMLHNPMDDSGEEFNPNIFPFEIKDPKDWHKPKEEDNNSEHK